MKMKKIILTLAAVLNAGKKDLSSAIVAIAMVVVLDVMNVPVLTAAVRLICAIGDTVESAAGDAVAADDYRNSFIGKLLLTLVYLLTS
jgi:hypothetical protein